jgi:Rrf2 family protein
MKLSRASSYALHAVVHMAAEDADRPLASHDIARAHGIPERFLLKVLKPLVSAQVLRSVKGPNGGYRLARPAGKITLLEVVEAVDGPIRGQVPFGSDGNGQTGFERRLETVCNEAADQLRRQLQKVRITDLVGRGSKGR